MSSDSSPTNGFDHSDHWKHIRNKGRQIMSVREEIEQRSRPEAKLVRSIGNVLSHPWFFILVLAAHVLWIIGNLPYWPWQPPDPYPFTFLATIASVEAPFIALLVLMHEQRIASIDELREELDLHVSLHLERQMSVVLRMLVELEQQLNVPTNEDPELLDQMQHDLDPQMLIEHLRQRLQRAEGGSPSTSA